MNEWMDGHIDGWMHILGFIMVNTVTLCIVLCSQALIQSCLTSYSPIKNYTILITCIVVPHSSNKQLLKHRALKILYFMEHS